DKREGLLHDRRHGRLAHLRIAHDARIGVRFAQRPDNPALIGDWDLREVILAHPTDRFLHRCGTLHAHDVLYLLRSYEIAGRGAREILVTHAPHPVGIEDLAEVAGAVIVEDNDNRFATLEAVLQL